MADCSMECLESTFSEILEDKVTLANLCITPLYLEIGEKGNGNTENVHDPTVLNPR